MVGILGSVVGSFAFVGALASTPFWLPRTVLRVFERVNGKEGIAVPGDAVAAKYFRALYAHPAANGRSQGAALSDLFWYWLSPGADIHQEHLEPGMRYDAVARTTRQFLTVPNTRAEELAASCVATVCQTLPARDFTLVRIRDLMMPVWARFYYELVFAEPCTTQAERLIVDNAKDVVTALKCVTLRHMGKRAKLTSFLLDKVRSGRTVHPLPKFFQHLWSARSSVPLEELV